MIREKGGDNVMKMTPSILLNIVLVTVLATSLFFISTTASTAEYNPWSDIDGDGDIDIYDVVKVTGIYGSSGDPTRNVNVTNWPEQYTTREFEFNISWNPTSSELYTSDVYKTEGYSRMFIGMKPQNHSGDDYEVTISLFSILWGSAGADFPIDYDLTYGWFNGTVLMPLYPPIAQVETKAPNFRMQFTANSTAFSGWIIMHVYIYLRNE